MYDVIKKYKKPSKELLEAFSKIEETASIHEVMGKKGALNHRIKPIWPETRMCGTALTVECGVGDNIMLHKAISMVQPGDVLVVTCGQYEIAGGMFGGMMGVSAKSKGAVGLVIEGACRDTIMLKDIDFPAFALDVSIKGTTKCQKGSINHQIHIGDIAINPGDIIIGDNDGVVVVPLEIAEKVLKDAQAREAHEAEVARKISAGEGIVYNLAGFDKIYEALGLTEEV